MQTVLDVPVHLLDKSEQSFVANIREHGWMRTSVSAEEGPGFSYTTGFWHAANKPELLVFAMKPKDAHDVFWTVFREGQIPVGVKTEAVFANLPAYLFPVANRHYADHLGWSSWFYFSEDFPCLQLVWADRSGNFPWEPGFDESLRHLQVDLTENGWAASIVS